MVGIEEAIRELLMGISHHPHLLYAGVIFILFASSFGLPLPEEVVLLTSGMIAYLSVEEGLATATSPHVNPVVLATICFAAVLFSDLLVFYLGRRFGITLLKRKPFSNLISSKSLARVRMWTKKYGAWACAVFRFTPGIRFPGHFICGSMKISYTKFLLTDGLAALLTVPTQVLLMAYYGDEILVYLKQFKIILIGLLIFTLVAWLIFRKRALPAPLGRAN